MENLQFNGHYISETICHNERRKCVSVQADFSCAIKGVLDCKKNKKQKKPKTKKTQNAEN